MLTDFFNCGKCANQCKYGSYCCGGTCADITSNTLHCGGCNLPCKPNELCVASACNHYALGVVKLGCRYVDIQNTGTLPLNTFSVTVDGSAVPVTAPAAGIAAGAQGRLYLAYMVDKGQQVVVTAHGVSATTSQATACSINLAFAKYGDQGGDYLALIRSINDVGADFTTKTGLTVKTRTVAKSNCGLSTYQHFLNVDTEDLTDLDLIYYHTHNTSAVGTTFKPSAAAEKKLHDWVTRGGLLLFDDCGGIKTLDLKLVFGITAGLDGQTGGSSYASQFLLKSDIYETPYKFTSATFSTTALWTEGGQTSLTGGLKAVVQRHQSILLSAAQVGKGWVAVMGGDWGCSLSCGCSAGTTVAHQLLMNFAYVAAGRSKLIK